MSEVHGFAEHEWAASDDAVDARRLALPDGICGHAAAAE
jgi:hypothetical protein